LEVIDLIGINLAIRPITSACPHIFLRKSYYLVLPGYNPRIRALYFCPQLFRSEASAKLVPLEREDIGKLLARSVCDGVVWKRPWYEPLEQVPKEPVVGTIDKANP
jgi:hypothetical protein